MEEQELQVHVCVFVCDVITMLSCGDSGCRLDRPVIIPVKLFWLAADFLMESLCVCYVCFAVWLRARVVAFLHMGIVCVVWFLDGSPVSSSVAIPTCLHSGCAVSNHLMWFVLVKQRTFLWWGPAPQCVHVCVCVWCRHPSGRTNQHCQDPAVRLRQTFLFDAHILRSTHTHTHRGSEALQNNIKLSYESIRTLFFFYLPPL